MRFLKCGFRSWVNSLFNILFDRSFCNFGESEYSFGKFRGGCSMSHLSAMLLDLVDLRVFSRSVAALDTAYNSNNDADAAKD